MDQSTAERPPLRVWPGVLIVALQWVARFVIPAVAPEASIYGIVGGLLGGLAILVWWALFSRAPVVERAGAVVLIVGALFLTPTILHESVATAGMGVLYLVYAIPVLCLAFVLWAVLTRSLAAGPRRATMVATILLACAAWGLVRTGGVTGDSDSDFSWRWSATPEELLLEQAEGAAALAPAVPVAVGATAQWPGFRGPDRSDNVRGIRIATDWSSSPPVELWRRPVGPGWSSFAVAGDLLYTQEQRGDDEVVACYRLSTGEPVWRHADAVRFWESNGGAGPRGTPTFSDGRVYALGATGILNVLDASDGTVVWSRNLSSDADVEIPGWGFASSPLVVGDAVFVAAAGRLAAYESATGNLRWLGPDGGGGYSSPHLLPIDGVAQVVLVSGNGASSFSPADGTLLWENAWSGGPMVQPAIAADGAVVISTAGDAAGLGIRRLAVTRGPDGWTAQEHWTSIRLKPYFSDFVVHEGHAYGFDGSILAATDLQDGSRSWKGGRYGHGQLLLLPDQDLLLVVTEEGELALVAATPAGYTELTRAPAIDGKTWNHPVLVDDILLVRNGQEMAAFRLPREPS